MKNMEKGQITIFLSLIFMFLLAVIGTGAEGVRVAALELEGEMAVKAASDSVLAAYDRDLLKEYELFYVNGIDENGAFSSQAIGKKLAEFVNANLDVSNGKNMLQGAVSLVEAGNFTLATDGMGQDFFNQAVDYKEKSLGVDIIENLIAQTEQGKVIFGAGEEAELEKGAKEAEFVKLEEENKETENHFSEENLGESNPLKQMEDIEAEGIWSIILKDKTISGKSVDLSKVLSGREQLKGSGVEQETKVTEKVLFCEYILEKFNDFQDEKNEAGLSYEVEYILAGKDTDQKNMEDVLNRLLIFREGVNYLYLHSDSGKVAEAEALATALVGFTGLPPVVTVVRELLLLSWAYGESVLDLQNLMGGGTLALVKSGENWQLELEDAGKLLDKKTEIRKEAGGLDYKGYIRLLLTLCDRETLTVRALDLVELNMRQIKGKERFRMDCCFSGFLCNATYVAKPVFLRFPVAAGMLKKTDGYYQFQKQRKAYY